jgi:hypothetical protein
VAGTAPVTIATLEPAAATGENGWYLGDVQLLLATSDAWSGVSRTEYSIDDGAPWQAYGGAFTISRSTLRAIFEPPSSVTVKIEKSDPTLELSNDRTSLWPPNGNAIDVMLSGIGEDSVSGLAGVAYQVVDEYGLPIAISPRQLEGTAFKWSDVASLVARRNGDDLDGREYRIVATLADAAGRTATSSVRVLVPHDRRWTYWLTAPPAAG